MKKLWFLILLLALLFTTSACGSSSESNANTAPATTISTSEQNTQPTPTAVPEDGMKSDGKIHVYLVGSGEKVDTPNSSFINYITYYSDSDHLIICMKGKEYVFANVPSSLWADFKAAESTGTFYNQYIKDNTAYYINDYDGSNGGLIVLDHVD